MEYFIRSISFLLNKPVFNDTPVKIGNFHRKSGFLSRLLSAFGLCAFLTAGPVMAGNQKEEAMADSVRLALSKAVTDSRPPKPSFDNINERIDYLLWLGEMSDRLKRRIPDAKTRQELLEAIWYESKRAGLEPAMVLGLIQVESAFRKYATSVVGARGFMQVMPFWSKTIGDGDAQKLFQMQTNLRYGCSILRLYIDMEAGNLYLALGRYNGSRGRPEYPNAVLANWKNWEYKKDATKN
ncbi:soluble lytic murein transglycosylase-like protein [Undibacterium sp. GrIS 1.2]